MPDICTLAIITSATLNQCWQVNTCYVAPGVVQTCVEPRPVLCGGRSGSVWQCKRDDGSEYWVTDEVIDQGLRYGILEPRP